MQQLNLTLTPDGKHYTDGTNQYTRCTTYVNRFFDSFNAEAKAKELAGGRNIYAMYNPAEIIAEWNKKSENACNRGTAIHRIYEQVIKGEFPDVSMDISLTTHRAVVSDAEALRDSITAKGWQAFPEFKVCSPELLIAGTIDLPLIKGNNLAIMDFKSYEKDPATEATYNKFCKWPFGAYPQTKLTKTAIQLNLYAFMLGSGYNISKLVLRHISHQNKITDHVCPNLQKEIQLLF